jgi:hypothetical protein
MFPMKSGVKLLSVAMLLSLCAMNPVWAAAPFADSVPDTLSAMASRTGLTEAIADLRRHAFAAIDSNSFNAPSATRQDSDRAPARPKHGAWMTLLAGVGLIGVLIGRAKRRYA